MLTELYNDKGEKASLNEVIEWWLYHYKGLEHLSKSPETWYAINSILERCLNKLKEEEK